MDPRIGYIQRNEVRCTDESMGEGAYGKVVRGKWLHRHVAIKKSLTPLDENSEEKREFEREADLMQKISHPNIIESYGSFSDEEQHFCIVMPLMKQSLHSAIKKKIGLTPPVRLSIAFDMARGVQYLHENGIIHRDLKSRNIVLTDDFTAKIIDFGGAIRLEEEMERRSNPSPYKMVGTLQYVAPEVSVTWEYSFASDVYALSIVLCELYKLEKVYKNTPEMFLVYCVRRGERETLPSQEGLLSPLKALIEQGWSGLPEKRPSAKEIVDCLSAIMPQMPPISLTASKIAVVVNDSTLGCDKSSELGSISTDFSRAGLWGFENEKFSMMSTGMPEASGEKDSQSAIFESALLSRPLDRAKSSKPSERQSPAQENLRKMADISAPLPITGGAATPPTDKKEPHCSLLACEVL
jgi:serine/threonine protein kinase